MAVVFVNGYVLSTRAAYKIGWKQPTTVTPRVPTMMTFCFTFVLLFLAGANSLPHGDHAMAMERRETPVGREAPSRVKLFDGYLRA